MIKVTLKDGSAIECAEGESVAQIAARISEGLARAALGAIVDGNVVELGYVPEKDCSLQILTFKDPEGRRIYRHTCSHVLAQAMKSVHPTVKLAIGPAIDEGFYYDFDFATPISFE